MTLTCPGCAVYSFGIILWELLTWRVPWEDYEGPWQVAPLSLRLSPPAHTIITSCKAQNFVCCAVKLHVRPCTCIVHVCC